MGPSKAGDVATCTINTPDELQKIMQRNDIERKIKILYIMQRLHDCEQQNEKIS